MSLKDRIIKKIVREEKEKFLTQLIQDPHKSLMSILKHYGIQFSVSNEDITIPLNSEEEIIINVKKQKRQIK